jgi:septal ring factor EnvC (AmiA/AmiB activator)
MSEVETVEEVGVEAEGITRVTSDPAKLIQQIQQYQEAIPKLEEGLIKKQQKLEHSKARLAALEARLAEMGGVENMAKFAAAAVEKKEAELARLKETFGL